MLQLINNLILLIIKIQALYNLLAATCIWI